MKPTWSRFSVRTLMLVVGLSGLIVFGAITAMRLGPRGRPSNLGQYSGGRKLRDSGATSSFAGTRSSGLSGRRNDFDLGVNTSTRPSC